MRAGQTYLCQSACDWHFNQGDIDNERNYVQPRYVFGQHRRRSGQHLRVRGSVGQRPQFHTTRSLGERCCSVGRHHLAGRLRRQRRPSGNQVHSHLSSAVDGHRCRGILSRHYRDRFAGFVGHARRIQPRVVYSLRAAVLSTRANPHRHRPSPKPTVTFNRILCPLSKRRPLAIRNTGAFCHL